MYSISSLYKVLFNTYYLIVTWKRYEISKRFNIVIHYSIHITYFIFYNGIMLVQKNAKTDKECFQFISLMNAIQIILKEEVRNCLVLF